MLRARTLRLIVLCVLGILVSLAPCAPAPAQAQGASLTPRFTINISGDIVIIGNTLMTCSTSSGAPNIANCDDAQGGASLNNNSFHAAYVDVDSS